MIRQEFSKLHTLILQLLFQERCRICRQDINEAHFFESGAIQCVCKQCWDCEISGWLFDETSSIYSIVDGVIDVRSRSPSPEPPPMPLLASPPDLPLASPDLIVASAIAYERPMKRLIRRYKFDDDRLIANDLSLLLLRAWLMLERFHDAQNAPPGRMILAPVPLSKKRLKERMFNQSLVVAQLIEKHAKIPVSSACLARLKATKPQSGLAKADRFKNVEGAFKANSKLVGGLHVILIDDVLTSGATLASCATALKEAGATKVSAVTVARAVLRNNN